MSTTRPIEDVLICGGGLAGCSVALQVRRALPEASITLLERRSERAPETTHKVGESIVELGSWHLRHHLGLEEHLEKAHLPKLGLRFFMRRPPGTAFDRRLEYGVFPRLGGRVRELTLPTFHVDRGRLENHLLERVANAGIRVRRGAKVTEVALGPPHVVTVEDREGTESEERGRFLVDATGRRALLKRALGLDEPLAHAADASWMRVDRRVDVERWGGHEGWRGRIDPGLRWRSTNHLVGEGYWIWLIPLPSGATSIGLVTDPSRLGAPGRREALLAFFEQAEPELAESIAGAAVLDHQVRRGGAYGCSRLVSGEGAWAIVGDAGFFLDPLYSPGADFIAIQSCLVTGVVRAMLRGEAVAGRAAFAERLQQRMLDQHLGLYRGLWAATADPWVMALKVAWDTAAYFGFNLLLFQHGLLTDPLQMARLQDETRHIADLQRRAQGAFHRALREDRRARGHVDQFAPDFLYGVYDGSRPRRVPPLDDETARAATAEDGRRALRSSLASLEGALEAIEGRLAGRPSTSGGETLWDRVEVGS